MSTLLQYRHRHNRDLIPLSWRYFERFKPLYRTLAGRNIEAQRTGLNEVSVTLRPGVPLYVNYAYHIILTPSIPIDSIMSCWNYLSIPLKSFLSWGDVALNQILPLDHFRHLHPGLTMNTIWPNMLCIYCAISLVMQMNKYTAAWS